MHIKLTNGQPEIYSIGQLRRDNPNISFPKVIPPAALAAYEVFEVVQVAMPDHNSMTQSLQRADVEQVNGVWTQGWEVTNLPTEDAKRNIRSHRDMLLQETDWMAMSDNTMSPAWSTYRQALRDVTAQTGFPYEVIWPTKPE